MADGIGVGAEVDITIRYGVPRSGQGEVIPVAVVDVVRERRGPLHFTGLVLSAELALYILEAREVVRHSGVLRGQLTMCIGTTQLYGEKEDEKQKKSGHLHEFMSGICQQIRVKLHVVDQLVSQDNIMSSLYAMAK